MTDAIIIGSGLLFLFTCIAAGFFVRALNRGRMEDNTPEDIRDLIKELRE